MIRQEPVQLSGVDDLPADEVHHRLAQYPNILAGIEQSHGVLPEGREKNRGVSFIIAIQGLTCQAIPQ